jgi:hypothetical protein
MSRPDAIDRIYELLSQLSPLVDESLSTLHGDDAPPVTNQIKRCLNDLHDKVNNKRLRVDELDTQQQDEEDEEDELEVIRQIVADSPRPRPSARPACRPVNDQPVVNLDVSGLTTHTPIVSSHTPVQQLAHEMANKILPRYDTEPAARTSIDFLFRWRGEPDPDKRELDGFTRIMAGYIPVDLEDSSVATRNVVLNPFHLGQLRD